MNITGTYNKAISRNRKNGFTSFLIELKDYDDKGRKVYFCNGNIPFFAEGSPVSAEGEFKTIRDKEIFCVKKIQIDISDDGLLQKFIYSNLPAGLGAKASKRVLELLKEKNITIEDFIRSETAIEELSCLKGFSKIFAVQFLNKTENSLCEKNLYYKLAKYGITFQQVIELRKKYKNKTNEKLASNPYEILQDIGVSFSVIDLYAKEHGIDYINKDRIKALTEEVAKSITENGHSLIPEEEYTKIFRAKENLISAFEEPLPSTLIMIGAYSSSALVRESINGLRALGNKQAKDVEEDIIKNLIRLKKTEKALIPIEQIEIYKNKITNLDDTQKQMLDTLDKSDICMLIGGPGTGKTTTIRSMLKVFKTYFPGKTYALCAPSGRAAQNIKGSTGEEAKTIHLLLEYRFIGDTAVPARDKDNQLDADLIFVDEFSMVDIFLFRNLLEAAKDGTKIVLVGDWNQLQSVGPGNLLYDMLKSGLFRNVMLTKIHRQAEESLIIKNALNVLNGNKNIETGKDFEVITCENNEEGKFKFKELFLSLYKNDEDLFAISPAATGDYGCKVLNVMIQEQLHTTSEPYIVYGDDLFFEGDRIMTIKNQYVEPSYYNGDIWSIKNVRNEETIDIESKDGDQKTLSDDNLADIDLAYALTVHKCQGSEADICVIFLPEGIPSKLITKALFYTAITRAKKKCIIINVNNTMNKYIDAPMREIRHSYIPAMLKELCMQY